MGTNKIGGRSSVRLSKNHHLFYRGKYKNKKTYPPRRHQQTKNKKSFRQTTNNEHQRAPTLSRSKECIKPGHLRKIVVERPISPWHVRQRYLRYQKTKTNAFEYSEVKRLSYQKSKQPGDGIAPLNLYYFCTNTN